MAAPACGGSLVGQEVGPGVDQVVGKGVGPGVAPAVGPVQSMNTSQFTILLSSKPYPQGRREQG